VDTNCRYDFKDDTTKGDELTPIAVALVFELEIHKPPPGEEGQFSSRATWFPPRAKVPKIRTLEERRAILGTYIITSMSVCFDTN
jgi:hypothetical protein